MQQLRTQLFTIQIYENLESELATINHLIITIDILLPKLKEVIDKGRFSDFEELLLDRAGGLFTLESVDAIKHLRRVRI